MYWRSRSTDFRSRFFQIASKRGIIAANGVMPHFVVRTWTIYCNEHIAKTQSFFHRKPVQKSPLGGKNAPFPAPCSAPVPKPPGQARRSWQAHKSIFKNPSTAGSGTLPHHFSPLRGYEDCCEHCGAVDGIKACVLDGRSSLLCEQCYWDLSDKKEGTFHSERNVEAADVFGELWTRARTFLYPRRGQGGTSYQMRDAVTEWNNRAKADSQE